MPHEGMAFFEHGKPAIRFRDACVAAGYAARYFVVQNKRRKFLYQVCWNDPAL